MAKDPAFLFFPGDWLGGTMHFTRAHKGAYMDLLMAQFSLGRMTLQQIKNVLGPDFETMWEEMLKPKFLMDDDGKFYNEKLDNEVIKRRNYTLSRRENLVKKEKHISPHTDSHMVQHMENGDGNGNKNKERGKGERKVTKPFTPPTIEEVIQYFTDNGHTKERAIKAFKHYDLANWHDAKGTPVKNWKQKMHTNWFDDKFKVRDNQGNNGAGTKLSTPLKTTAE